MKPVRSVLPTLAVCLALAACSNEAPAAMADTPAPDAPPAAAQTVSQRLPDFELRDQNGVAHRLYSMKDAKAVVLVMQGNGCPIVQKMTPTVKDVSAAYQAKGVKFLMVNSNIQDTPEAIAAETTRFDLKLPVLKDQDQSLGKRLGAVRTAESFIIDPKTWKVVYHGPIDDRLTYGRERAKPENHYLRDALDAVLAGKTPAVVKAEADGCLINYVKPEHG
jgi:peroxiredoxin